MAKVKLKNVTKRFGDVVAVSDLSLEVEDKEFMVLLGPSGCGKTTILRCIAGLETPDEGGIYIDDVLVNDFSPKDRDVAMVFQSYALYPHMRVFDNIAFPLKMRKLPKDNVEKMVKHTAELLRISDLLDRRPKQLSGGEAQRTALGRAIVREPKAFLMDEPLSNLDAKLRLHMRAELKRLQKDLGVTTVYVTHDQAEAMTLGDKIAVLNKGALEQLGTPEKVYDHPTSMFVAGFIGSPPMNFIDCTFKEEKKAGFLDARTFTLSLSEDLQRAIKEKAKGPEIVLGFRPEDVTVHKKRPRAEFITAEIYVTEPLGAEVIVDLKVGDQLVKASISPELKLKMGEKVYINLNKNKIHIFDKKTEKAII